MKQINQHSLLFIFLIISFLTQGQELTLSKETLRHQIQELEANRNFITKSACPQKENILNTYQTNFDTLLDVLNIATLVYNTPIALPKDRIKKQGDKFITYRSTNLTNVIVKRYSTKISMAGIVSDNSSISIGTRLLTETFTLDNKKIEVLYRVRKNKISLINIEAIYTNKTRVYIDIQYLPQGELSVYNTNEYGTEFKKLYVLFSNEIGKLNFIKTTGYELYPERYTEMITQNQGIIKYRYAIRCYDEKGNQITPTQKGKEFEIKPKTYLLWYKGTIGKNPIHLMLKRGFVKENEDIEVNDTIISNVQYAYDNHKKWINIENLWERQAGIFGFEGEHDDTPEWHVEFYKKSQYGKVLTGNWDNQNGKTLPIKLIPMTKEFPVFTFKAQIEEELSPSGSVENKSITALTIYKDNKKIQQINLEESKPNLDYFDLTYVDINYDGYLDLVVDNSLFLYNPNTNTFKSPEDEDGWEYIPNLTELYSYNPYTKSFTVQQRSSFTEYRVINGKLTPYASEYSYFDEDGNAIYEKQRYINGKWQPIEKSIEQFNDEEDEKYTLEDEVDIASPKNYTLNIDLTIRDGNMLFSPDFYNNTGTKLTFKDPAKFIVEVTDSNGILHKKFLYNIELSGNKGIDYLDDSYLNYDGETLFYESTDKLIPFFPPNINQGNFTFQLALEHPLFGTVRSKKQAIQLPFQLKIDPINKLIGNINDKVRGTIYYKINDNNVIGSFINTKTGKNINLKGTYTSGFFGVDTLNLAEYESEDKLSGYFEGTISTLKGKNKDLYKGYWISPNKKTRVPFTFKKQQ